MAKKMSIFEEIVDQYPDVKLGTGTEILEWVDTGNYALNKIVSGDYFKGLPLGRIVEYFGEPSTGKSLMIYEAMANFQKKFGEHAYVILDDTEDVFTEHMAKIIGIDVSRMILLGSETVEEHFGRLFLGIKGAEDKKKREGLVPYIVESDPDAKILIALDSVAMLSTLHERQVGFEKSDMSKAKNLRAGIRMVNRRFICEHSILYLIANHVMAQIGGYGNSKTTPGGKSIPFMSSVRLELSLRGKIKDGEKVIGVQTQAHGKKNKIAPPFAKTIVDIMFDKGMDEMSGAPDMLALDGYIKEKGGWFELPDGKKIRRGEVTIEVLKQLIAAPAPENEVEKEGDKS